MTLSILKFKVPPIRFTEEKFNTEIFPYILIFLAPFIDMLNGFVQNVLLLPSPIGLLFRGSLIIYTFKYIFTPSNGLFSSISIIILFLYSISMPIWLMTEQTFDIGIDLTYFFRILYYMTIVSYFWKFKHRFNIKYLAKLSNKAALISSISLLICATTGIGVSTYEIGDIGIGTRGFFTAGNDVGLFMNICLIITIVNLKYFNSFKQIILILATYCANLVITTRVAIAGGSLIMLLFFSQMLFNRLPYLRVKKIILSVIKVFMIAVVVVFIVVTVQFIQNTPYLESRFSGNPSNTRELLIEAGEASISNFNFRQYLIGRSYTGSMSNIALHRGKGMYDTNLKSVEAELHDTVSSYGYLLGGSIILIYLIPVLLGIKIYNRKRNYLAFWNVISLILFTGIAIKAGHAYTNAMVFPMMSVIFISAYYSPPTLKKNYG